ASQVSRARPQLCHSLPPLFQPDRRSWRPSRSDPQFRGKPSQVVLHVDVVEGIREANGKLQSASAHQQGLKRALSTHAVTIEERWVSGFGPNEIIAAIMCWSNHHVVPGERLERAPKNRSRQMRAVAVEGNDAFPASRSEVCKHRGQACRKALPFLRHDAHLTLRQPR